MLKRIIFCFNSNKRRCLFGVAIFTALTVSAAAVGWRRAESGQPPASYGVHSSTAVLPEDGRTRAVEPAMPTTAQGRPTPEPLQVVLITIGPEGFQPAQITVPKGRYALVLLNRADLPTLSAQLSRAAGNGAEKIKDIKAEGKKRYRWHDIVDLPPGDYVISEQSNPQWMCRITATNP